MWLYNARGRFLLLACRTEARDAFGSGRCGARKVEERASDLNRCEGLGWLGRRSRWIFVFVILFVTLSAAGFFAGQEARAQLVSEGVSEAAPVPTSDSEAASSPTATLAPQPASGSASEPTIEAAPASATALESDPAPANTEPVAAEPPAGSSVPAADAPAGETAPPPAESPGVVEVPPETTGPESGTEPAIVTEPEVIEPVAGETPYPSEPAPVESPVEPAPTPSMPVSEPVAAEPLPTLTLKPTAETGVVVPVVAPDPSSAPLPDEPDYAANPMPAEPAPQDTLPAPEPVAEPATVGGSGSGDLLSAPTSEGPVATTSESGSGAVGPAPAPEMEVARPPATETSGVTDDDIQAVGANTTDPDQPATGDPKQSVATGPQVRLDPAQPVSAAAKSRGVEVGSSSAWLIRPGVSGLRDRRAGSASGLFDKHFVDGDAKRDPLLHPPLRPYHDSDPASQAPVGGNGLGAGFVTGLGLCVLAVLVFPTSLRCGLSGLSQEFARIGPGFKLILERPG